MGRLLVDGREFVTGRCTGIGRFLEGLLLAAIHYHPEWHITLGMREPAALPPSLQGRVEVHPLPRIAELAWPNWSREFDLFLSPYPKLPLMKLGCPAIHTVHDVLYLTHPVYRASGLKSAINLWVLKQALSRAALSWFDSDASQNECEVLTGMGSNGVVRHLPVSELFIADDEEDDDGYYLFVGNGLPHKNLDMAMQALQRVDGVLKCVGVRSDAVDQLKQRYPELRGRLEFVGPVDDYGLLTLYRRARVLLFPSTAEGYGYPPLEAMACGTPAIVSDIPVLRETTGGHALFCDPHDVKAWRDAMLLIQSVELKRRIIVDAQPWIEERRGLAGWKKHITDIESLL